MTDKPSYQELERRVAELEAKERLLAEDCGELEPHLISQAQKELQAIYSMSLDMVCIADIQTSTFLKVNPAFTTTLGYSEAELLSVPFTDFVHPEDLDATLKILEESERKGRRVVNFKNRYRCKSGGYRWLSWTSSPVPERRVTYAVAHDITEEIHAYEALRGQRNLLNSLFNNLPMGIAVLDSGGRLMMANKGFTEITGYTADEMQSLEDWFPRAYPDPDYRRSVMEDWLNAECLGTAVREYKVACRDGGVKDLEFRVVFLRDGRRLVTMSDVTERRKAVEEREAFHRRFTTVLDSIDATVFVADMDTYEILFMNRRMIEEFGGDRTGEICWKALRKKTAPCKRCTNQRLIDENGQPVGVFSWQGESHISGKCFINSDRAIEWIDGRIVRLQISLDITQSKKMEDALRKAQKMEAIGTLASGVAHDFNNLLMGIQGRASLISASLAPGHPHCEHIAAIEEHVISAASLTKQLLGLARSGKFEVKPFDINALLETSAAMFGRTRKQIRIKTRTTPESTMVEADKRQIEQVLLNIYVNASQAMPDGGDLILETSTVELDKHACNPYKIPPGRFVKISLTDTGVGMAEDVRQKVFDPFFTTKEKERGTGLGLASAYGIVQNHGGMITVYSEPGHGSTFNIYLPSCEEKASAEAPCVGEMVGGTETVLIIDDEPLVADVGKAMLELLGYRVIAADSGSAAIRIVSEAGREIDLAILDLIMPGLDGGKTFDRIREIHPSMPVILSSGYSIDGQAAEILKRGCNGFIQKPFNIRELAGKIREILDSGKNLSRR